MNRKRGIVMIISLVSLAAVTMLVGAAIMLMPTALFGARQSGENNQAYLAASSGADYAQSRLQADPNWRGNGGPGLVVDLPDLQIREEEGNVIGIMSAADGTRSAFRMRFNFQNGTDAPDEGLGNPGANYFVNFNRLCINNLSGVGGVPTYAVGTANPWRVEVAPVAIDTVARGYAEIWVEGLSGPALAGATPENLNVLAQLQAGVSRQSVQCRMGIGALTRVDNAVAAGNDLESATDNNLKIESAESAGSARLRSLGDITVTAMGAPITAMNLDMAADARAVADLSSHSIVGIPGPQQLDESASQQAERYLRLTWDEVPKATGGDTTVRAGTYVWRSNGMGGYEMHHYVENFDGSTIPTGVPDNVIDASNMVLTGPGTGITLNTATLTASVNDKVFVQPNGSVSDFAVLVDPTIVSSEGKRARVNLNSGPLGGSDAVLTTTGNLHIDGSTEGYGAITTEKNVTIQGASAVETDPEGSIALYARGDVTITAIPQAVVDLIDVPSGAGMGMGMSTSGDLLPGGLSPMGMSMSMSMGTPEDAPAPFALTGADVSFAGLVYTQRDFIVNTISSTTRGNFYMRGVLTAFGGDPASDAPGALPGLGRVRMTTANTRLVYDPSYLQQLFDGGVPTRLERTSWNVH